MEVHRNVEIRELSLDELDFVEGGGRWGSIAIGAGYGAYEGLHVAGALRAGFLGARIGAFAGPIGLAAGVAGGIGVYYIAEYLQNN